MADERAQSSLQDESPVLQATHDLRRRGLDVVVGFVETHKRAETAARISDLERAGGRSAA